MRRRDTMRMFLVLALVGMGFALVFSPEEEKVVKSVAFTQRLEKALEFITEELQKVNLTTVITDKKIYHPREKVQVFVAGLNHPRESLKLALLRQTGLIYEQELSLDEAGMGLFEIEGLDIAEYQLEIKKENEVLARSDFSVVEYTFSPLTAQIINYTLEKEILKADLSLKVLGVPLEGKVTVNITCEYCQGQTIQELKVTVKEGFTHIKADISRHTGPFGIKLFTPDGKTASLMVYGTEREEREEYLVNDLGIEYYASLVPREGSFGHLGLFLRPGGVTASYFQLKKVIAEMAEIKITTDLTSAAIVAVDPVSGKHRLMEYSTGLDKGRTIQFKVDRPYSLVYLLAEKSGKIESFYSIIFRPNPINLRLSVPEEAKPGSPITIKIGSDRSCKCLLAVYDTRLDQEKPETKLGKNVLTNIKENRYVPPPEAEEPIEPLIEREALLESFEKLSDLDFEGDEPSDLPHYNARARTRIKSSIVAAAPVGARKGGGYNASTSSAHPCRTGRSSIVQAFGCGGRD